MLPCQFRSTRDPSGGSAAWWYTVQRETPPMAAQLGGTQKLAIYGKTFFFIFLSVRYLCFSKVTYISARPIREQNFVAVTACSGGVEFYYLAVPIE